MKGGKEKEKENQQEEKRKIEMKSLVCSSVFLITI